MQSRNIQYERAFTDFEQRLEELKSALAAAELDLGKEVAALERAYQRAYQRAFRDLSAWQKVWLARHPQRPRAMDYVEALLHDRTDLDGDRIHGDDPALRGGFGWFDERPVVFLAQQKGRNTRENLQSNFGMMHPEGYRKARRLMRLAAKFRRPVLSFVDTPAAHPGADAELRGQAMAIAENLFEMAQLSVPMIAVIVGEGGSGGALGVAMGNVVLMMEYAVYCVAPPEACSGILWKDAGEHAPEAAEGLKLTAPDLLAHGVIDEIVAEPLGGAHRDPPQAFSRVRRAVRRHLNALSRMGPDALVEQRYAKYRAIGFFAAAPTATTPGEASAEEA
jgi:acetyl-CoA carboxylase carboxyl transferase subunit alpha